MLRYLVVLVLLGTTCHVKSNPNPEETVPESPDVEEDFATNRNDFRKLLEDMLSFFWNTDGEYDRLLNRDEDDHHHDLDLTPKSCPEEIENANCKEHSQAPMPGCCIDIDNHCANRHGGKCFESWKKNPYCNFMEKDICGNDTTCYCCIDCDSHGASACEETGGRCLKKCGIFMLKVPTSCRSPKCSCCVNCLSNGCEGSCLGDSKDCASGYYIEPNKCVQRDCVCCRPCVATAKCIASKGYPENKDIPCKEGYESNAEEAGPNCVCCQPKIEEEKICKMEGVLATDERNMTSFCTDLNCPANFKQFVNGCEPPAAGCRLCEADGFRKCIRGKECESQNGYCSKGKCAPNYFSDSGDCTSLDDVPCHCCKPICRRYE
ncbi:protein psiO-like [Penaeus japonicus]|uniref:protein psiO-like n=1 Tax=Penaeus japonicus TaxID=27405 RepID=UPI001C71600F|nr:protein psiO-like [Penaeus japonicus]